MDMFSSFVVPFAGPEKEKDNTGVSETVGCVYGDALGHQAKHDREPSLIYICRDLGAVSTLNQAASFMCQTVTTLGEAGATISLQPKQTGVFRGMLMFWSTRGTPFPVFLDVFVSGTRHNK